jgi:hypothetical protein
MHARYTAEEENVDTTGTAFCLLVWFSINHDTQPAPVRAFLYMSF